MFQVYRKVIQLHTHIYFSDFLHYRLLQDIEYSSLGHTLGFCCLFILYIVVYLVITNLPLPSIFQLVTISLFSMSTSLVLFGK